eukprot:SAG25_NODE_401_length_8480_cov_3.553275_5_plen_80_part_00
MLSAVLIMKVPADLSAHSGELGDRGEQACVRGRRGVRHHGDNLIKMLLASSVLAMAGAAAAAAGGGGGEAGCAGLRART